MRNLIVLFFAGLTCYCPDLCSAPAGHDFSKVPGVVIDYIPAKTGTYIGSPSIARLQNGNYVASHDIFGPRSKQNKTMVFLSEDSGKTWKKRSELVGQWWSTIFTFKDSLYLIGVSKSYGHVVIRRSVNAGKTWTTPRDRKSGLLLAVGEFHCAPVPLVIFNGRIWRAFERYRGKWGYFDSFVISAPVDCNLLEAENWTISRFMPWGKWKPYGGWLEGNVVVAPGNKLVNILRVHAADGGKAAVIHVGENGKKLSFDPEKDFIDLPGGAKKFTIRFDAKTKRYWSLVNYVLKKDKGKTHASMIRNTLALASSRDLKKWSIRSIILHNDDVKKHGFQYVDWLFEGDDIIAVSRTAFDDGLGGAHSQHDADFLTFHRIRDFRKLKNNHLE